MIDKDFLEIELSFFIGMLIGSIITCVIFIYNKEKWKIYYYIQKSNKWKTF